MCQGEGCAPAPPDIEVAPAGIDFGVVAQGFTEHREVTVVNAGGAALTIQSVTLTSNDTGEFALTPDEDFGPLATSPIAHVLPPEGSVSFEVTFTNTQGDSGQGIGALLIRSDDPADPEQELSLSATRGATPECVLEFSPPVLDYGVVSLGRSKALIMAVQNVGSGSCTFKDARVTDCEGLGGAMITCDPSGAAPSATYELVAQPAPVPDGLGPRKAALTAPNRLTAAPTRKARDMAS